MPQFRCQHELFGLPPQEALAERQIFVRQVDHGSIATPLLKAFPCENVLILLRFKEEINNCFY